MMATVSAEVTTPRVGDVGVGSSVRGRHETAGDLQIEGGKRAASEVRGHAIEGVLDHQPRSQGPQSAPDFTQPARVVDVEGSDGPGGFRGSLSLAVASPHHDDGGGTIGPVVSGKRAKGNDVLVAARSRKQDQSPASAGPFNDDRRALETQDSSVRAEKAMIGNESVQQAFDQPAREDPVLLKDRPGPAPAAPEERSGAQHQGQNRERREDGRH